MCAYDGIEEMWEAWVEILDKLDAPTSRELTGGGRGGG